MKARKLLVFLLGDIIKFVLEVDFDSKDNSLSFFYLYEYFINIYDRKRSIYYSTKVKLQIIVQNPIP